MIKLPADASRGNQVFPVAGTGGFYFSGNPICQVGIPDDADQCSGDADQRFRDDGDHDSGMMPITRSGMIPIS